MSVHNCEKYLPAAIESILSQSFRDFEFVIIDSGSTDGSAEIMRRYDDPRIVFCREKRSPMAATLNKGVSIARGEYIGRMDADDISLPLRLEKEVSFLDAHPDVGIVGSWAANITEDGEDLCVIEMPADDTAARTLLQSDSPFFHGAVMFRKSIFSRCGGYPTDITIEDWVLWHRFAAHSRLANIPEVLYKYRMRPSGAAARTRREIRKLNRIMQDYLHGIQLSEEDLQFARFLQTAGVTRRQVASYWLGCGILCLAKNHDRVRARRFISKSIAAYPLSSRGVAYFVCTFLPSRAMAFLWATKRSLANMPTASFKKISTRMQKWLGQI
jgi:glycosyltransferase involved in cell wall biosynthesis